MRSGVSEFLTKGRQDNGQTVLTHFGITTFRKVRCTLSLITEGGVKIESESFTPNILPTIRSFRLDEMMMMRGQIAPYDPKSFLNLIVENAQDIIRAKVSNPTLYKFFNNPKTGDLSRFLKKKAASEVKKEEAEKWAFKSFGITINNDKSKYSLSIGKLRSIDYNSSLPKVMQAFSEHNLEYIRNISPRDSDLVFLNNIIDIAKKITNAVARGNYKNINESLREGLELFLAKEEAREKRAVDKSILLKSCGIEMDKKERDVHYLSMASGIKSKGYNRKLSAIILDLKEEDLEYLRGKSTTDEGFLNFIIDSSGKINSSKIKTDQALFKIFEERGLQSFLDEYEAQKKELEQPKKYLIEEFGVVISKVAKDINKLSHNSQNRIISDGDLSTLLSFKREDLEFIKSKAEGGKTETFLNLVAEMARILKNARFRSRYVVGKGGDKESTTFSVFEKEGLEKFLDAQKLEDDLRGEAHNALESFGIAVNPKGSDDKYSLSIGDVKSIRYYSFYSKFLYSFSEDDIEIIRKKYEDDKNFLDAVIEVAKEISRAQQRQNQTLFKIFEERGLREFIEAFKSLKREYELLPDKERKKVLRNSVEKTISAEEVAKETVLVVEEDIAEEDAVEEEAHHGKGFSAAKRARTEVVEKVVTAANEMRGEDAVVDDLFFNGLTEEDLSGLEALCDRLGDKSLEVFEEEGDMDLEVRSDSSTSDKLLEDYVNYKKRKRTDDSRLLINKAYEQEAPFIIMCSSSFRSRKAAPNPFDLEKKYREETDTAEKTFFVINNHGNNHWDSSISTEKTKRIKSDGADYACGVFTLLNIISSSENLSKVVEDIYPEKEKLLSLFEQIDSLSNKDVNVKVKIAAEARELLANFLSSRLEYLKETHDIGEVFILESIERIRTSGQMKYEAALKAEEVASGEAPRKSRIRRSQFTGEMLTSEDLIFLCKAFGIQVIESNTFRGDVVENSAYLEAVSNNLSKSPDHLDYKSETEELLGFLRTQFDEPEAEAKVEEKLKEIVAAVVAKKSPPSAIPHPVGGSGLRGAGIQCGAGSIMAPNS